MEKTETLEEFYRNKYGLKSADIKSRSMPFHFFRFEDCPHDSTILYSRRDFFMVALLQGNYLIHYADKSQRVAGSTLLFFSPEVPYTIEPLANELAGYFCIFQEAFYNEHYRGNIRDLPMFTLGNKPHYSLSKTQDKFVRHLFQNMQKEVVSDYAFKYDLIRNYVAEIIYYALKMEPAEALYQPTDANVRITAVFQELLEKQFPIDTAGQRLELRSARDFADRLAVHVNHLNRALKITTGKTTTAHIAERLVGEAKALLKHTNWNIAEISYRLGFEDAANFNHFFKKQTRVTPSVSRGLSSKSARHS